MSLGRIQVHSAYAMADMLPTLAFRVQEDQDSMSHVHDYRRASKPYEMGVPFG